MTRRAGERGFALIAALWLVVAVSFVLASLALESRPERHIAANVREQIRARAAARAGLALALARIRRTARDETTRAAEWIRLVSDRDGGTGGPVAGRIEGTGRFEVRLDDQGARLSLKTADLVELRRLFRAAGVSFSGASVAAQSVLDWRDPDGLHRPSGAEWDDHYRHLDPPVRPRNGPFRSLEELLRVRGVDRALFRAVGPLLTVRSDGPVNVNTAPEPVLVAVPGLDRMAAAVIQRRRRLGRPVGSLDDLAGLLPSAAAARLRRHHASLSRRVAFEPRRIVVTSVGRAEGSGARVTVRALAARRQDEVQVLWRLER